MESTMRHNLNVVGTGNSHGGLFNKVSVTGECSVTGDIDCIDIRITGTLDVSGKLITKSGKIHGEADVNGDLESEDIRIYGTLDISGNAKVKDVKAQGELNIKGGMSGDIVDISGFIKVKGGCTAESFVSRGPLTIGELLNAGTIDMMLHSKCQIREIGGEKITVKRGTEYILKRIIKSMYLPSDFYEGTLIAEAIEGDDIYLEYTNAKVVRGNNIIIGPGCEIDLIEYKDNLEQDKGSKINESKKINVLTV